MLSADNVGAEDILHVCRRQGRWTNYAETNEENIFHVKSSKAEHCFIHINDKMEMEKDTGASCSLISKKMWNDLGRPVLRKSSSKMISYDGHEMHQLGVFDAVIETSENKLTVVTLFVIDCDRPFGLAGRDLFCQDILNVSEDSQNKYAALCGVKGALATIKLKPDARPI